MICVVAISVDMSLILRGLFQKLKTRKAIMATENELIEETDYTDEPEEWR